MLKQLASAKAWQVAISKRNNGQNSTTLITRIAYCKSLGYPNASWAMYYRQLTSIHEDALEDNWTLIRNEGEFPCPVIHEDQKEIIANLITGISELAGVTIRIRAGYNTGEVGFRDRTRLLEVIEEFRSVFRRNLGRRLNEFYSNYGEFDTVAFRHLHTAGYIEHHDYERMYEEFGAKGGEEGDPPLNVAGHGAVFGGRKPRIFLSYRRDDTNFAVGRLREKLIDAVGNENVFQDINIPPGRDFHGFIEQEIARCDILIAVIGVNWTKPIHVRAASGELDYVRLEIETAIEKGKTVIPALLAPAELPALTELPGDMRPLLHCQACTVRPDPDFHNSADRLVEAIVHEFSSLASLEE